MHIMNLCNSGDSLRVHLPVEFVRQLKLKCGDQVVVNLDTEGKLLVTPLNTKLNELARREARYVLNADRARKARRN